MNRYVDREELRSLLVRPDGQAPSPEAERRVQSQIDRLMLRSIDTRAELRLERPRLAESDHMMAEADMDAFKRIQDPAIQGHAAAQIARNVRDSQVYRSAIEEAGLAEGIAQLDAVHTTRMLQDERDAADEAST